MNFSKILESRLVLGLGALLFLWFILLAKTFHIQIVKEQYFSSKLERQSVKRTIQNAERGLIYDRNGNVLVKNLKTKIKVDDLDNNRSREVYLDRFQPFGKITSQLIGITGRNEQGQMGIEYSFNEELKGIEGWKHKKVDAWRKTQEGFQLGGRNPVAGLNLYTTIDIDIQEIVNNALEKGVDKVNADRGAAVVVDVNTGEILAMATYPSFNPNDRYDFQFAHTKNDIVSKSFEPGSTFKLIAAAAALEENKFSLTDSIDANQGRFVIYGDVIRDHHKHGKISFSEAMAFSSNVAFAKIAQEVGKENYYRYVRKFGFGHKTGIQIPGEEKGKLKPIETWSGRTLVTMAMGHEIMSTPIQIAMAYAAIANGGNLLQPQIVKKIYSANGELVNQMKPKVVRKVVSEETASILREMLHEVVSKGTARNLNSEVLDIAGKTGTAEKYDVSLGRYKRSSMNSSFVGMFPATHPRYVCYVVVDEPRTFTSGARTAGPIFKEIAHKMHFNPRIDQKEKDLFASLKASTVLEVDLDAKRESSRVSRLKMPDLKGLSLREAMKVLKDRDLNIDVKGSGWIVKQFPGAGEFLDQHHKCELLLEEEVI